MIKVAFYTGSGRLIDNLIRWWTDSQYSHCEILFSNGEMFSADAWSNSTRFNSQFNPDHWEFVELQAGESVEAFLYKWCMDRVGKKYDWLGVIGFVLPWFNQDSQRWFCSEVCGAGLKFIGKIPVDTKTSRLTPQALRDLLV